MVIGGFLGAAVWRIVHGLPAVPDTPAPFVVVGMIACFGSIAHAPLAVMLMVAEMTGSLQMLAPAMVAVGLASAVVGDATIYENQLRNRNESPAHRFRLGLPMLASLPVREAAHAPPLLLRHDTLVGDARVRLDELRLPGAPVVDERDVFRGSVDRDRISTATAEALVVLYAGDDSAAVPADSTLEAVVEVFATHRISWVPALDDERRVAGIVGSHDLIAAYRRALAGTLATLRPISPDSILVEMEVLPGTAIVGRTIAGAGWPSGTVVIAISRGNQLIFPESETQIDEGDVLSLLVPEGAERSVRALLGGPGPGAPTDPGGEPDATDGPTML